MKTSLKIALALLSVGMLSAEANATYIGNNLAGTYGNAADSINVLAVLGQGDGGTSSLITFPSAGTVTGGQANFGSLSSANITYYLLRYVDTQAGTVTTPTQLYNQRFQVISASQTFNSGLSLGVNSLTFSTAWNVLAGDMIAVLGRGYMYDNSAGLSATNKDATYLTPASGSPGLLTVGNIYKFFSGNTVTPSNPDIGPSPATGANPSNGQDFYNLQKRRYAAGVDFTLVPEPTSALLAIVGSIGITSVFRRRRA
jgi:hypothetical protein